MLLGVLPDTQGPAPHARADETRHPGRRQHDDAATARLIRRTLRQWPLVLILALLAGAAGYFYSSSQPKEYESTTTIQLQEVDLGSVFLAQNLQQQGQDATTRAATTADSVTFPRVREAASRTLKGAVSADDLADKVSVDVKPNTTLIAITAKDGDPKRAQQIADAIREAFLAIRRQMAVSQFKDAADEVQSEYSDLTDKQKDSDQGQMLHDRLQQIGTLRAVSNGGVVTAQTARIPDQPSGPAPVRTAVLAFLLGGALGLGIAFLRARFDDRIRDPEELTELWDIPLLGTIPRAPGLKDAGRRLPSPEALEAFALTRTNLRYLHVGASVRRVVVTSAVEGEGKSTVAWNLALAAAHAGVRVVLIDADLRRPVQGQRLDIHAGGGLSEVLAGIAAPTEVAQTITVDVPGGPGINVDVVASGMVPPSPIALLERPDARDSLAELCEGYDLAIFDTPPVTVVGDAKVLMTMTDGVVIVSRLGRLTRRIFNELRAALEPMQVTVLGVIVNGGATRAAYGVYGEAPSGAQQAKAPTGPTGGSGSRPRSADRAADPRQADADADAPRPAGVG